MEEPTQTTPKGAEIPVPTHEEWERTLRKVVKPVKPLPASSSEK